SPQPRPKTASRSAANSMRTSMPRASKSATPKWPPSTSKAMHSIQNGITPSRPVCPKIQDEVLNLPHRLSGKIRALSFLLAETITTMRYLLLPFTGRYMAYSGALIAVMLLPLSFNDPVYWLPFGLAAILVSLGTHDLLQTRHSLLRNYPIVGHIRFILEEIRPEVRQYFAESDTDGQPFSRTERSLAYERAKITVDKFPFGTELDVNSESYEWLNHSIAPKPVAAEQFRITVGGPGCLQPYSISVLN